MRVGLARSRREARNLISFGRVRVNGHRIAKGDLVRAGDQVELEELAAARIQPNPEIPLLLLREDPEFLAVEKPGLIPCHPLRSEETTTLMNAVVARFPETADAGDNPLEGGLVHRLDNGTSGALIVARKTDSFNRLRAAIRGGAIGRRYLALVSGHVGGNIELNRPIAHHPKNRRKMVVCANESEASNLRARPAITMAEPLGAYGRFTLLSVRPRSGMRHQIRVHLASAGHPLVGDSLYGANPEPDLADGRFFLHLEELTVPASDGSIVEIHSPLPADLRELLASLKSVQD